MVLRDLIAGLLIGVQEGEWCKRENLRAAEVLGRG